MGKIYIDKNVLEGWASEACVGEVDSNGYVYNSMHFISGWGSGTCIGRVDTDTRFVYNDKNVFSGWASSACLGSYDEKGYVYNDKNVASGFASTACVGQMDSNGYVYTSMNYFSGWMSGSCVGRVDGIREAAALLLIVMPQIYKNSASNAWQYRSDHQENVNHARRDNVKDPDIYDEQYNRKKNDSKQNKTEKEQSGSNYNIPGFILLPLIVLGFFIIVYIIGNREKALSQINNMASWIVDLVTIILFISQCCSCVKIIGTQGWRLKLHHIVIRALGGFFLAVGYIGVIDIIGLLLVAPIAVGDSKLLSFSIHEDFVLIISTLMFTLYLVEGYYHKKFNIQTSRDWLFNKYYIFVLMILGICLMINYGMDKAVDAYKSKGIGQSEYAYEILL